MRLKNDDGRDELWLCSANSSIVEHWKKAIKKGSRCSQIVSVQQLFQRPSADWPDIVLVHLGLPGLNGAQEVVKLTGQYASVRFMAFTEHPNDDEGLYLLRHGYFGYFNAYLTPHLLAQAIDLTESGQVLVSKDLLAVLMRRLATAMTADMPEDVRLSIEQLTGREREILLKVCDGMSNKRIANLFNISERTVKAHLSSIFRKTHTNDRMQLAMRMTDYCRGNTSL